MKIRVCLEGAGGSLGAIRLLQTLDQEVHRRARRNCNAEIVSQVSQEFGVGAVRLNKEIGPAS